MDRREQKSPCCFPETHFLNRDWRARGGWKSINNSAGRRAQKQATTTHASEEWAPRSFEHSTPGITHATRILSHRRTAAPQPAHRRIRACLPTRTRHGSGLTAACARPSHCQKHNEKDCPPGSPQEYRSAFQKRGSGSGFGMVASDGLGAIYGNQLRRR